MMTSRYILCLIGSWLLTLLITCVPVANGNHDAKRLYDDLLRKNDYNKLIRPAKHYKDRVAVKLGLKLSQLIGVDVKNQIISLNMWLVHEWQDHRLAWEPKAYGNVTAIYVPSESIWLPDIVLYNNADGDYTVTIMTKATLAHQGILKWQPPVIYKSQCDMNVEFFPFDEQSCWLKFGSWTYADLVDLQHVWMDQFPELEETAPLEYGIDLKDFYKSVEWDIMAVPAQKHIVYYPCCENEPYPDITFNITLRRKTLYFTYNLIIPCVSINMLTLLTFYLPSDSGEKISLCISILLSLSVFQLILMDLIPATSITVPLIGKYILFTMVLVSLSVFISVVTLHVNFRSSATHGLPELSKKIFLKILPRLLFMKRPDLGEDNEEEHEFPAESSTDLTWGNPYREKFHPGQESDVESLCGNYSVTSTFIGAQTSRFATANISDFCYACAKRKMNSYPPSAKRALEGCIFIAKHLKDEDDGNKVKDDWKYMALVIDRFFLYLYISVCLVGALGILLNAPVLYDNAKPLGTPHLGIATPPHGNDEE